jgi:hypothetical protein
LQKFVLKPSFQAHFDNLPDEFKVVDGAKGTWSQLILLDAMIYILENDSFNSSSRRAFNQHKVLCECVLDELEMIHSMAHFEIMEWKLSFASKGNKYNINSETVSQELVNKYSHLVGHSVLQYPWNSLDNLRTALIEGPASKAKNKFSTITEMLMNNDSLAHFGFDMDLIVQAVIHRVLFVFKNHKNALGPLMSRSSGKKNKREHHSSKAVEDESPPDRATKVQKSFAIPLSNTSTPLLSSNVLLSIMNKFKPSAVPVVTSCIPVQLAATMIPAPLLDDLSNLNDGDFDFFDDLFEGDGVAHGAVPVVIVQTDPEHLCAIVPVLPMTLLSPELIDTVSHLLEDEEGHFMDADTFDMLNSLTHSPRSPRPLLAAIRSRSFSEEEEEQSVTEDSWKSDSMSSLSSCSTPVTTASHNEREEEGKGKDQCATEGGVMMTFNPSTTKYILQDNVLCALVPVSDPKVIAAHHAAAAQQHQQQHSQQQSQQQIQHSHQSHQSHDYFCGFNSLPTIAEQQSLSSASHPLKREEEEDSEFVVSDGDSSDSTTVDTHSVTTSIKPTITTTNSTTSQSAPRRRSSASSHDSAASSQQQNDAHMTSKTKGDLVTHTELTNTCLESLISGECFDF